MAVALSGGSDSTALLHLTLNWAHRAGVPVCSLTVDHGLRTGSAEEARSVADAAQQAGADAHVLVWTGPHPATGIQNAARDARYALMDSWCAANGACELLLGHQMEDQAATVLMRLRRGSGPAGLAGMLRSNPPVAVRVARPLLAERRQTLRDWLTAREISWIEDPTNLVDRHERNRLDRFLESEDADGALVENLYRLSTRQARVEDALDKSAARHWEQWAREIPDGIWMDRGCFVDTDEEMRVRLLGRAIRAAGGTLPGLETLERLPGQLFSTGKVNAGGVLLTLSTDRLIATPEPPRR